MYFTMTTEFPSVGCCAAAAALVAPLTRHLSSSLEPSPPYPGFRLYKITNLSTHPPSPPPPSH